MRRTSILLLLLFLFKLPISAQNLNTLSIESPVNIAGEYPIIGANFGQQTIDSIVGKIVIGTDAISPELDGCTELTNNVEGSICILDRGACAFDQKVLNAQNAGAIAVIICQNTDEKTFLMYGTNYSEDINIYAGMISKLHCDSIKMEIENHDINIKLHFVVPPCVNAFGPDVVWGENGEGEFDGGLGDWIAEDSLGGEDTFTYSEYGINQGVVSPGGYSIQSSTVCNGVASMDFDFYTTNGDPEILENLTSPFQTYSGYLTSPSIDLSDVENPVVHFQQLQARFDGYYSFQYSIDNGLNWSEEIDIDTENFILPTATFVETEEKFIEIPEAAFQSEVKIRFSYHQVAFYVWMLDDIYISGNRVSSTTEQKIGNTLSLSPNPSNGNFSIKIDHEINFPCTIKIQTIGGQNVYSHFLPDGIGERQEFNITNLPEGLYFVLIENEHGVFGDKLVIRN